MDLTFIYYLVTWYLIPIIGLVIKDCPQMRSIGHYRLIRTKFSKTETQNWTQNGTLKKHAQTKFC